ncbi:DUF3137 domain-containing protein [Bacteroides uniformis]|nr:DUF3137 domain-containing protein [Bacteroides uniformis]
MLLPDHLENKIGYLAQTIQGMKEKYGAKFVHLEDPEFERHFAVYADDEVEARMVLTPAMMRKLTALRKSFSRDRCSPSTGTCSTTHPTLRTVSYVPAGSRWMTNICWNNCTGR